LGELSAGGDVGDGRRSQPNDEREPPVEQHVARLRRAEGVDGFELVVAGLDLGCEQPL